MCHHVLRSATKLGAKLTPVGLAFCLSLFAGCDSTVDPSSPEAQKQAAASREVIDKSDAAATEQIKKRMGKGAPTLKSNFKGGMGTGAAPAGDAKPGE
jgi:hypothetical protein